MKKKRAFVFLKCTEKCVILLQPVFDYGITTGHRIFPPGFPPTAGFRFCSNWNCDAIFYCSGELVLHSGSIVWNVLRLGDALCGSMGRFIGFECTFRLYWYRSIAANHELTWIGTRRLLNCFPPDPCRSVAVVVPPMVPEVMWMGIVLQNTIGHKFQPHTAGVSECDWMRYWIRFYFII